MYNLITCLKRVHKGDNSTKISISFLKMIGVVTEIAILKASMSQSPEGIVRGGV